MASAVTETPPQHMTALAKANQVRLARAELKHKVAEGETTVAAVIDACPWEAVSMTMMDLLMAQHRWGRTRSRRFLTSIPMSENKTVGSLTQRQRTNLISMLGDPVRTVLDGRERRVTPSSRALPQPEYRDYLTQPL